MKRLLLLATLTLALGVGLGLAVNLESHWGAAHSSIRPLSPSSPPSHRASQLSDRNRGRSKPSAEKREDPAVAMASFLEFAEEYPDFRYDYELGQEFSFKAFEAFSQMNADEIQLALAELDKSTQLDSDKLYALREALMVIWSKIDGPSCMDYVLANNNRLEGRAMAREVLSCWTKQDPHEAYEWFLKHREMFQENGWTEERYLLIAMASQDAAAALDAVEQMSARSDRRGASLTLEDISRSAGQDPAARRGFLALLETHEDPWLKRFGMAGVFEGWAYVDLEGALNHLKDQDPDSEDYESAEYGIMEAWGRTDPEAAFNWKIKKHGLSVQTAHDIGQCVSEWADNDVEATSQWLAKQPAGQATDQLHYYAATSFDAAVGHPDQAIQWAMRIQDESIRHDSLARIDRLIQRRGEQWVSQWMDGLEPRLRDELLKAREGSK